MIANIEEAVSTRHETASHPSWQIVPERDATRKKEAISGARESFYWLTFGQNPALVYQQGAQTPYGREITDVIAQQQFATDIRQMLPLYEGQFAVVQPPEQADDIEQSMTIVGSFEHQNRGRAAIIIRHSGDAVRVEHTWIVNS